MAPRNKSMPPNRIEDAASEDVSLHEGTHDTNDEPEVTADDAWAAAEGYTPLADMRSENGAMFMAFNPGDNDDNEGNSFSGAFFVDTAAFGTTADEWDDQDSDEDDRGVHENNDLAENEFRSVADQALQALDQEYSMALSGVVPAPSSEQQKSSTTPFVQKVAAAAPTPVISETAKTDFFIKEADPNKDVPPINTDAVRKAVNAIKLKAPRLTTDLNKWEEEHGVSNTSVVALAPRNHPIIPKAPLSAFWRESPKAISATANLSRAATLAEVIHRLSCLELEQERLVIDIVGADHVECSSDDQLRTAFGPLVRWLGAMENSPRHIEIRLVGPNVPTEATKRPPVDLMPTKKLKASSRLESATATCHEGTYHEWIQQEEKSKESFARPDVAIAFNSGIWGYNEWLPTLNALCESSWSVPFVSTAYTIQECEDDADVIEKAVSSSQRCLWKAEANPFASRQVRATASAVAGREYRENAAWQAWRLGGNDE